MYKLLEEKIINFNERLPYKIKISLNSIICFLMVINTIFPIRILVESGLDAVIVFVLCILLAFFNLDRKNIGKKYNILVLLLVCFGLLVIIVGIHYRVLGYISVGFFYLTVTPIFIYVISDAKKAEDMLLSISIGIEGAFILLFFFSVLFCPLGGEQYQSFTGNPNSLGIDAVLGLYASLYLFLKTNGRKRLFLIFLMGFSISFIIFSRSRTALLAMLVAFFLICIYYCINRLFLKIKMGMSIIIIACIVASVFISYIGITYVNDFLGVKNNDDLKESIEKHICIELDNSSENIGFGQAILLSSKRSLKGITDENSFSSGRIVIWKKFIENINFQGHKTGTLEIDNIKGFNAHSGYIQVAYSFGIIAGILYLLITIYILFKCFKLFCFCISNKKMSNEILYILVITGGFFIESTLAAAVSPFSYVFVLMLNICVIPFVYILNGGEYKV